MEQVYAVLDDSDAVEDYELQREAEDPIAFAASGSDQDTLHYNAAMKAHDSEDFKVAMIKEANEHTTRLHWALWEKHNVPAGHKILSAIWAFKQKASTPITVTPGGHTRGNTPFPPKVRDLVLEFKKGIKREPASFTVLKDNKQWDSVHRTLKAQTCDQDVDDVLNPCYVPNTAEDIALFDEKQKYMYSVLEQILQTDEGKVIVRSHHADHNAQSIYAEFLQVMTQSTEAMMNSGELLAYLTTILRSPMVLGEVLPRHSS
jgi:hypothetical protein